MQSDLFNTQMNNLSLYTSPQKAKLPITLPSPHSKSAKSPVFTSISGSTLNHKLPDNSKVQSLLNPNSSKKDNIYRTKPSEMSKPVEIDQPIDNYDVQCSPELLASSVGYELGGVLVPSTSNISLLSLNQQPQLINNFDSNQDSSSLTRHNYANRKLTKQRIPSSQQQNQSTTSTSMTYLPGLIASHNLPSPVLSHSQLPGISSRKSSFNSPTAANSAMFVSSGFSSRPSVRRSSSNMASQQQPIQITRGLNRQSNNNLLESYQSTIEPDSPFLTPVSAAGSPSNYFLNNASPPNSLKSHTSSYMSSNLSHSYQTNRYNRPNSSRQQAQQLNLTLNLGSQLKNSINRMAATNDNVCFNAPISAAPLSRQDSIGDSIGGRSPEFAPVSLTLPPMTPLTLSISVELESRSNSNTIIDEKDDDSNNFVIDYSNDIDNDDQDVFGERLEDEL